MIRFAGRACRLPMAPNVEAFEELLYAGRSAVTEIPETRWRHAPFFHPVPGTPGRTYSFAAGVIDGIDQFDPAVFGISPREALYMDPQQRLFLQVVWEALEDACLKPSELAGRDIGVFAGASLMDYGTGLSHDPQAADSYIMSGSSLAVIANRVSHIFDWHGPSMTIDTACSSSLFALSAALQALEREEVEIAVVGATNALLIPNQFVGFAAARMLSPTGLCQAFGAGADGYVRGEGAVAFVLVRDEAGRRLSPRHRGRLLHVETNTSGRTVNIALPSEAAQFSLLQSAYQRAGIDPDALAFVEAHGTGTAVGDPVEAGALGRALGQRRSQPLPIGSVKSNIGHLEPAAGSAGLLKSLIALEKKRLPPSLHAARPNPAIAFDSLNLSVANEAVELGEGRLAGVSSFGFGGANAHAVIAADPPDPLTDPLPEAQTGDDARPVLLASAFCREALQQSLEESLSRAHGPDGAQNRRLHDEALHLRDLHPVRAAILSRDAEMARAAHAAFRAGKSHPALETAHATLRNAPPVFLFSGNGAQYAGMSLAAYEGSPAFRAEYDRIDRAWQRRSGWSLVEKLNAPDLATELKQAPVSQPLLFADQAATARALMAAGVQPAAVLGHSAGEVAAALTCGALDLDQAVRLIEARSMVQQALAGRGTMAALQLGAEEARAALADYGDPQIEIAAENSPRSVSLVGPREALEAFTRHARKVLRLACVPIRVDYPFHSSMQESLREALFDRLGVLKPGPEALPFHSSVTGGRVAGGDLDSFYWWRNMRQPVLFHRAMAAMAAEGRELFLEIGPDPVLAGYARDVLKEARGGLILPGLSRRDPASPDPIERLQARLLVHGAAMDRGKLAPRPEGPARELGHYPWQLKRFDATRTEPLMRTSGRQGYHPLLGIESAADAHQWQNEMDPDLQSVFADHRVGGQVLLPGTALVEMALAAAERGLGTREIALLDFDMLSALPLPPRSLSETRVELSGPERRLRVSSRPRWSREAWRLHASGRVARAEPDLAEVAPAPDPDVLPGDGQAHQVYRQAEEIGLSYGPGFRNLSHFRRPSEEVIEVLLQEARPEGYVPRDYLLDPVSTDAVLHGLIAALDQSRYADLGLGFVPVRVARLTLLRPGAKVMSGRITLTRRGERSLRAEVTLYDEGGEATATLHGVEMRALRLIQPVDFSAHAFGMDCVPLPRSTPRAPWGELPDMAAETGGDPLEEPALLLDALARRIAMDAMAEAGDAARPERAACLTPLLPASSADAMGAARPPAELPEADALLAGISAEYPSLVAECAALARLAEVLPDVLAGRADLPSEEQLFGRGVLQGLTQGSPLLQARARALAGRTMALLGDWPDAASPPRLLDVSESAPLVLSHLRNALPKAELWCLDDTCDAPVPPPLAGGIGRLASSHLKASGGFDMILGCGSGLRPVVSSERLAGLRAAMRPGALLLLSEQAPRPHVALLRLAGEQARETDPEAIHPPRLQAAEGLQEAAIAAGAEPFRVEAMPRGGGGSLLIHAKPAEPEEVSPTDAAPDLCDRLWSALGESEYCAALGQVETEDALFLVARPEADPEALRARILQFAKILRDAEAEGGREIWLIAPQGAAAAGLPAPDPAQAALWALARTAKNEYPACRIHAVDCGAAPAKDSLPMLLELVARGTDETELVLQDGTFAALRVRMGGDAPPPLTPALRLMPDPAGGLDRLAWRSAALPEPGPGEVRLKVEAVGLNYRDVMWSMGLLPEEALDGGFAGPTLGLECAGRIEALGEGVEGLQPGQLVASFGPSCLSSHMTTGAEWVAPLPEGISAEAGATMPVAFFTAWYALQHLGQLQPGETVLIHGAAGGVGFAAVQIAQWRGAKVIATAGTEAKRAYLRALGVDHVHSSRDLRFAEEIPSLAGGVDLVLNALAGEAMERSLALLNPFGRFLELGKVDFYANTGVGLRPLKENIAYHGVDIDRLLVARPELARSLFAEVMGLIREAALSPLPYRAFPGEEAQEAFRLMQRSGHIGKVVLHPPRTPTRARPEVPPIYRCDAESVTLIAGGGGGLGLELADRLVRNGARKLAVMGRSAVPGAEMREAMTRARDRGAEIRHLSCDITDRAALHTALAELRSWGPLSLVVNSAMVLKDMRLADLSEAALAQVMAAKITGTENLDLETRQDSLRNFVVFTSMATLIGNHGQGAYVAANAWAEALVRRRHAQGLPALAVGWGAITDAGYLTRDRETAQLLKRFGGGVEFGVRQALRALDQLLEPAQQITRDPVIWVSPMSWAAPAQSLRLLRAPTFGILQALGRQAGEGAEGDDLREAITALSPEAAVKRLTAFLGREIARILRVPEASLSASRPVSEFGVDSLMGVELGLAAQQALGDDIPLMAISDAQSMEEIAARMVAHIQGGGRGHALADLASQHLVSGGTEPAPPGQLAGAKAGDGKMEAAE
ncbi:Acyl transferase domain-containing protein [Pseudooceanicola antarcticus]|nr:type I polyketide synthase [Pseudooceanicola antarcticus]SNY54948.1 Acyl transferase domain-containing protein [Pseudooceanicola antarcticus]